MDESRRREGAALRAQAQGARHDAFTQGMRSLDPRVLEWSDGWIFGEVWAGEGISFEDRFLVAIVALAAIGNREQLRIYLHGAVQNGMDARRIHEALLMLPVYVGFPVALGAMVAWQDVVASARRKGVEIDVPVA
jgi:4-carboxymuconolactone decarboxylase